MFSQTISTAVTFKTCIKTSAFQRKTNDGQRSNKELSGSIGIVVIANWKKGLKDIMQRELLCTACNFNQAYREQHEAAQMTALRSPVGFGNSIVIQDTRTLLRPHCRD